MGVVIQKSCSVPVGFFVLCVFLSFGVLRALPGREIFERAYNIEKDDPRAAVGLYQQALESKMEPELHKTARWRLVYLFKQLEEYTEALLLVETLGSEKSTKVVQRDIRRDMSFRWGLPAAAVESYIKGIGLLQKSVAKAVRKRSVVKQPYLVHFRKAIERAPQSQTLRMKITQRLNLSGQGAAALQFLEASLEASPAYHLMRADSLLRLKRGDEAEEALRKVAQSDATLETAEKARLLYLLGRIYRNRNLHERAVPYFRLAAFYAEGVEKQRQKALAAYSLYNADLPLQAMALLRGLPAEIEDYNIRLLRLVLRVEVDEDFEALQELFRMAETIYEAVGENNASNLVKKAYRLITDYR